jgi:hypothetical protein
VDFKEHSAIAGRHAFLSPSQYHWLNYDTQKLTSRYHLHKAAQRGTDLHNLAHQAIKLGIQLANANKTLSLYVRHGIGFKMTPEQMLYYSDNCFGEADTISFRAGKLRIHDLKTGHTIASMKQLYVYAALFCLEYGFSPYDIEVELRIYQNGAANSCVPTSEDILTIMDTIIAHDRQIELLKEGLI